MRFFAKAICRFSHVVYCSWACFVLVTSCLPAGKMYLLTFYRWDCQHQMNRRNKMSLKSKILWIEGHIHQSAVLLWRSNSLISTVQFTLWHNPVRPKPHPIHTLTQSSSLYGHIQFTQCHIAIAQCRIRFPWSAFALCVIRFSKSDVSFSTFDFRFSNSLMILCSHDTTSLTKGKKIYFWVVTQGKPWAEIDSS